MCLFNISILKLKDGFIPSLKVKVAWHRALANKALDNGHDIVPYISCGAKRERLPCLD